MLNVVTWLRDLRSAIQDASDHDPPRITMIHKRVIYPGLEPIHGTGFLRFQGLQQFTQPGNGTGCISLTSWLQAEEDDPDHLNNSQIARSVGALLSLALNRTVEVPGELPISVEGSSLTSFLPLNVAYDRILHAPVPTPENVNASFREVASQICSLGEDDIVALGAAIEMHHAACMLYSKDISSAYVLVVGALETLSGRYEKSATSWPEWDKAANWDSFARNQGLSDQQHHALQEELLRDRQIRLGERFTNYVEHAFDDRKWLDSWEEWTWEVDGESGEPKGGEWAHNPQVPSSVPSERRELRRAIKRSYAARSGFVHAGRQDINLASEPAHQVIYSEGRAPLPFTVLRAALGRCIRAELSRRSTEFDFPEIETLFDQ